ncbi:acetyl/propionyl/methylcrotonyl-CoA carboxylase subunit alpha, partial [Fusobacterium ulcerans]|uniref:acetyl-CoA carboxylase biotin carboxylase subunit n=1 Tax=Fusobacterium ulcerans TaxID=861 RepID=UPI0026EB1DD6
SLFRTKADESYLIGRDKSPLGAYLDIDEIIKLAKAKAVDAIHPGYGFLAENAEFAAKCEKEGITFIGPSSSAMEALGDKIKSKIVANNAKVPTIPGIQKPIENDEQAKDFAKEAGYPVIIKASFGGGGRGMRVVNNEKELIEKLHSAKSEAKQAFGNDAIFIEKYLEKPKHIEVQILGDKFGNIVHLFERDCSIQRRHQKLIEEAPSFSLPYNIRKAMGEAAVTLAKAINYDSAGTLEFLVDKNNDFFFMEMNTRVQVEHTVTEMVTGVDIIKLQIKVAAGEKLNIAQDDVILYGHAIECRINAEDPENDFLPSPGVLTKYIVPGGNGIRVDSHSYQGYEISPYYDSMIGKLIAFGINREEAIAKMKRALSEYIIEGIDTTIPFHLEVFNNELYLEGKTSTNFIEENFSKKNN